MIILRFCKCRIYKEYDFSVCIHGNWQCKLSESQFIICHTFIYFRHIMLHSQKDYRRFYDMRIVYGARLYDYLL